MKLNELDWTLKLWKFVERIGWYTDSLITGRERRLWDGIRVDILTNEYAVEVDWAPKYAEAIGQSLLYALYTKKRPGIVLLVEDLSKENKYIYRCKLVCEKHNIRLWLVDTKKSEIIDHTGARYEI